MARVIPRNRLCLHAPPQLHRAFSQSTAPPPPPVSSYWHLATKCQTRTPHAAAAPRPQPPVYRFSSPAARVDAALWTSTGDRRLWRPIWRVMSPWRRHRRRRRRRCRRGRHGTGAAATAADGDGNGRSQTTSEEGGAGMRAEGDIMRSVLVPVPATWRTGGWLHLVGTARKRR